MKYKDLIKFEPINEVVKFDKLSNDDYSKSLVRNFVFSETYEHTYIPEICRNLDYSSSSETFGIQLVGNYGTGKSHLMSLVSLIAENADYVNYVQNASAKTVLNNIAGKYKVVRFELGSDEELWKLVCYQIDKQLKNWGVDYSISADITNDMYKDKLSRMMAYFENAYPDQGLMVVIDEMLSYLKGRSGSDKLNRDLAVLQALGEMSDRTKFRMIFGVQEMVYKAPEFQFAAQTLQRVNDRYKAIEITKQEVQFVVQQRLLRKDNQQMDAIRSHLTKFEKFFPDMHANMDTYVNLYPVHPAFFDNFQQIKTGKSQREVLKTLSAKFQRILENDVPMQEPGLICYDAYWEDLQAKDMQTNPDVRRITEIMEIVHQKISDNFKAARAKKIPLAKRIADACAIKILQDDISKTNGANPEVLADDLCYLDATCLDREMLVDIINTTANQIVSATVGQYFEKNQTNSEYHLRVEGGVNYEQKIKDFVSTMSADVKDSFFFQYLVEYLPIEVNEYRTGFNIYQHSIEWKSHKVNLDGYIFMGNPNERSTTQPQQYFYIYFMPIFNAANIKHGNEADSVYFHLDKVSPRIKELFELYGAAASLEHATDTTQKLNYQHFKKIYSDQIRADFHKEYAQSLEVYYQGQQQSVGQFWQSANGMEDFASKVSSALLDDYFCSILPDYPKFTLLKTNYTKANKQTNVNAALQMIADPAKKNQTAEAILSGLGLLQNNVVNTDGSIYAVSIKNKLKAKGQGQVLNQSEILYNYYPDFADDWRSVDYNIPSELEFVVLVAMVAMGEIEISFAGKKIINATNIKDVIPMLMDCCYTFSHIAPPKNMNYASVRELFMQITGKDMTSQLGNPDTFSQLQVAAANLAKDAVMSVQKLGNGIQLCEFDVVSSYDATNYRGRLQAISGLCDKVPNYCTEAKMRNLPWTADVIRDTLQHRSLIDRINKCKEIAGDLNSRINYLKITENVVSDSDPMRTEIQNLISKVSTIASNLDDDKAVADYKHDIDILIDKYADWYIDIYKNWHISELEMGTKNKILNSNAFKVCQAVCQTDNSTYLSTQCQDFKEWNKKIGQLTVGDNLTRNSLAISPIYGSFNPKYHTGEPLPKLSDLENEIENLYDRIDSALQELLKDKKLQANIDLVLDGSEKALLLRYSNKQEALSPINAQTIMLIIKKLNQGITKIELKLNDLRNEFNRPMTYDEAAKVFKKYLDKIVGNYKGSDDVRIIIK